MTASSSQYDMYPDLQLFANARGDQSSPILAPSFLRMEKVISSNPSDFHQFSKKSNWIYEVIIRQIRTAFEMDSDLLAHGSKSTIASEFLEDMASDDGKDIPVIDLDSQDESASPAELEELMSSLLAPTEECGPAIAPKVAERFEGLVKRDFSKVELDKLKNEFKPPENAKLLGTPRIQAELWNSLPQKAKSTDAKLQETQKKVSQALVGTAQAMNLITSEWKTLPKEFRTKLSVTILSTSQCLAIAMKDLNHQRRLAFRPFLRKEVATVGNNIAPSLNLFGDKLEENIKTAKAAASMIRSFDNNRFQPYSGRGRTSSNLNWRGKPRGGGGGRGRGSQSNFHQNQPFHHRQFNNKPNPQPPNHNQNNN